MSIFTDLLIAINEELISGTEGLISRQMGAERLFLLISRYVRGDVMVHQCRVLSGRDENKF